MMASPVLVSSMRRRTVTVFVESVRTGGRCAKPCPATSALSRITLICERRGKSISRPWRKDTQYPNARRQLQALVFSPGIVAHHRPRRASSVGRVPIERLARAEHRLTARIGDRDPGVQNLCVEAACDRACRELALDRDDDADALEL